MNRPPVSAEGFREAARRLREPTLILFIPGALAIAYLMTTADVAGEFGFDFRGTLYDPAVAILDGRSPYPPVDPAFIVVGNPAVYPPLFMLLAVPLGLVPFGLASAAWIALLVASVVVSLRLLAVSDWRCYALALTSPAVLHGVAYGNLTVALLVPLALAWRYRDRPWVTGIAVGAAVSAKLFLWPLVFWLLFTRRLTGLGVAIASAAFLTIVPWALIGFDGFRAYPDLLRLLQDLYAGHSFSLATALAGIGVSPQTGARLGVVVGLILVALAAWLVRGPEGDRRAFTVVVAASIVASPIVWPSYLALLIVPIALARPSFSPLWAVGYAAWVAGSLPAPAPPTLPCCKPEGMAQAVWVFENSAPFALRALGVVVVAVGIAALAIVARQGVRRKRDAARMAGRATAPG